MLQVFAFTADQLEVVRGVPEARRHFIDRGVASLRPAYVQTVSDYNKVIKQKNRILQDASERELRLEETENLIAPWNEQLATSGRRDSQRARRLHRTSKRALERTLFEPAELQIRYALIAGKQGRSERLRSPFARTFAASAAGRSGCRPRR